MSSIRSNTHRSSRSPNIPLMKETMDIVENRLGDDFPTPDVLSEVVPHSTVRPRLVRQSAPEIYLTNNRNRTNRILTC